MPPYLKYRHLGKLALTLARAGDESGAMKQARAILFPTGGTLSLTERKNLFLKLAETLVKLERQEEADRILKAEAHSEGVGEVLAGKAVHLAQSQRFSEALRTIDQIDANVIGNQWSRAKALAEIASRVLEPTKSVYLSQVFQAAFWII
jgi:hypothetical protein